MAIFDTSDPLAINLMSIRTFGLVLCSMEYNLFMAELMSPFNIFAAVTRLESELPALVGPEVWTQIGNRVIALLDQLRQSNVPNEQRMFAGDLFKLLVAYPDARERLTTELRLQDGIGAELTEDLALLASQFGIDTGNLESQVAAGLFAVRWSIPAETFPNAEEVHTKSITVKEGGLDGAKSVKFRNLDLDFEAASEIAAGAFLQGFAILDKPHPFVIAAGMLLLIRALRKTMTVQISERDASVFWGFIQARNQDNIAPESAIFDRTNKGSSP
jgi:hypothetical protein